MTFAGCPNTGFPVFIQKLRFQLRFMARRSPLGSGAIIQRSIPGHHVLSKARQSKSLQQIMGESLAGLAAANANACQLSTSSVSWAGPIRLDSWAIIFSSPPPRERKITQANELDCHMKRSFLKWRNTHLEWTHGKPYLNAVLFVSTKVYWAG